MSATTFADEPRKGPSAYRILGWAASAVLHGGALAFVLYGMPQREPPAAPAVITLEMVAEPVAPAVEATPPEPAMEQVQAVAPEAIAAAAVPPPPAVTTTMAEPVAVPPPPEPVTATAPPDAAPAPPVETLRAVEPETQQAVEPDALPLEAVDIPPPPPAPPPPPVQARAPAPPPPRPVPRREAPPAATPPAPVQREAPPGPAIAAPAPAAAAPAPSRAPATIPAAYLQRVFGALVRAQRYPTRARLARIEGTPYVTFSFRRDGTVISARLERSSGNADLDEEVVNLVMRASPLPRPGDDFPNEVITMTAPVNFNIR